jgi:hypothetical protein
MVELAFSTWAAAMEGTRGISPDWGTMCGRWMRLDRRSTFAARSMRTFRLKFGMELQRACSKPETFQDSKWLIAALSFMP